MNATLQGIVLFWKKKFKAPLEASRGVAASVIIIDCITFVGVCLFDEGGKDWPHELVGALFAGLRLHVQVQQVSEIIFIHKYQAYY